MAWQEILGYIGGAIMTSSMFPQIYRLFKLKSAREISLPFTLLFVIGAACWLSYGILLKLFPVMLWNAITLASGCAMVYAKLRYGR